MRDIDMARGLLQRPEPAHELVAVGMRRKHRQVGDIGFDRDILAVDLDRPGAPDHGGAAGARRLEA
jgi:hypothetical protein